MVSVVKLVLVVVVDVVEVKLGTFVVVFVVGGVDVVIGPLIHSHTRACKSGYLNIKAWQKKKLV